MMCLESHYSNLHSANSYENAFFYSSSGDYINVLAKKVVRRLGLEAPRKPLLSSETQQRQSKLLSCSSSPPNSVVLLDLGGGTGNFTRQLLGHCESGLVDKAIVVDPYLLPDAAIAASETTEDHISNHPNKLHKSTNEKKHGNISLHFVQARAQEFSMTTTPPQTAKTRPWWQQNYHVVLMKEVVHHFSQEECVAIFRGIYDGMIPIHTTPSANCATASSSSSSSSASSVLIITRPQHDIDYPLWKEAQEVWAQHQPPASVYERNLSKAGFVDVMTTVETYPCVIPLSMWQELIQGRFWSTFTHFSDVDLEKAALKDIPALHQSRIDTEGNLHFDDRLVFISARKVNNGP